MIDDFKIPDNEMDNVMSCYWSMLRELESKAQVDKDPVLKHQVGQYYTLLNRLGYSDYRPVWEKK